MAKRRDAGRPRGKPVEEAILAATLEELAARGIEGASVARIAKAAEVNKTTIYRRWGTIEALAMAALRGSLEDVTGSLRDMGSLREDVVALVELLGERMASPQGRALTRAALSEQASELVGQLAQERALRPEPGVVALVMRAVERGEWDMVRCPPEVVMSMVVGSVMSHALLRRQPVTEAWARSVADMIVRAVAPTGE